MTLPLALTIPAVTVCSKPNGLPMAITQSPTSNWLELPRRAKGRLPPDFRILIRARSILSSFPISRASYSV